MRAPLVLAFALALALAPTLAGAAEISLYETRLEVAPDGTGRATCTLEVAGAPGETLEVPLSHGAWANLRLVAAPEGLRLDPPAAKAETLRLALPPGPPPLAAARVSFAYDVPAAFAPPEKPGEEGRLTMPVDSRSLRYVFVNTQPAPIRDFRTLVVLPASFRFQAIREQLPRPARGESEPRVRLGAEEGRQTAVLRMRDMRQGDDTSMRLEAVPGRRSLLWLAAGVVLSALYLYRFRDLVTTAKDAATDR